MRGLQLSKYIVVLFSATTIFTAVTVMLVHGSALDQLAPSAWFADTPKLETFGSLAAGQSIPFSVNGNRDCSNRDVVTKEIGLAKTTQNICFVDSAFGGLATNGMLQRPGTDIAGQIRMGTTFGSSVTAVAIPQSSTLLYIGSNVNGGSFVFFKDDAASKLKTNLNSVTGEATHVLQEPGSILSDRAGNSIALNYDSLSFSRDGQWLVADSPFRSLVRVNTKTREILPFGTGFNYNAAVGPNAQTAITSDGRYALVASTSFTRFDLYDLATCGPAPNSITAPLGCQKLSLWNRLATEIPNFTGISTVRFIGDDALSFYAISKDGASSKVSQYVLYTGDKPLSLLQYLGLGDSFSSGEGAFDYKSNTDTTDNHCHLSQKSYPFLVAASLSLNTYNSVACSGAVLDDLYDTSGKVATDPQAKGKVDISYNNEILAGFLPGYRAQVSFVEKYKPQTITLSAVGNDIGFSDKIKRCVALGDTCYSTYEDRVEIANEVSAQFYRLTDLYQKIKQSALPSTKIYVVGYPKIIKEGGACGVNVHLNEDEATFANQLADVLNQTIKRAADNAGVFYVDVSDALVGHRLCEATQSEIAMNGLTAGNDSLLKTLGSESYHPNAYGQNLLALAILAKTNNLTAPMPASNTSILPADLSQTPFVTALPKTSRSVNTQIFKPTVTPRVMPKNSSQPVNTPALYDPNSSVQVWINSTPTLLATGTADASGAFTSSYTLPSTVGPGIHTLHIYGVNAVQKPIDVYTIVEVVDPASTACPIVGNSGKDRDHDGIDDNCDQTVAEVIPDTTPPTITYTLSQPAGPRGWHNAPVTVTFTCNDTDSGIASCEEPTTVTATGTSEITGKATDKAGNTAEATAQIYIDTDLPHINYSAKPERYNGWNNSPVTIKFSCSDDISTIDTCTEPITLTEEGASQTVTGTAVDQAQNQKQITPRPFQLDFTKPTISYHVDRQPNSNGWYQSPVTVSFTCEDALSGINQCTKPITISQDGVYPVTGQAEDVAGNRQEVLVFISIDATPPTILATKSNTNSWTNTSVRVHFDCDDQTSPIVSCSDDSIVTTEGINQSVEGRAVDAAGNQASILVSDISIDTAAPVISNVRWSGNPKSITSTATYAGQLSDNLSGAIRAEYFLGTSDPGKSHGATITPIGNQFSIVFGTDYPPGVYQINVRVSDVAGNWSDPTVDYLVVYAEAAGRVTGKRLIAPARSNGDILPFYDDVLVSKRDDDKPARFGFAVQTDRKGNITKNSDFQFSYKTGNHCDSHSKATHCHSLTANATNIEWVNIEKGIGKVMFAGMADVVVDGVLTSMPFLVEAQSLAGDDIFSLKLYQPGKIPMLDQPVYLINKTAITKGSVKISS